MTTVILAIDLQADIVRGCFDSDGVVARSGLRYPQGRFDVARHDEVALSVSG